MYSNTIFKTDFKHYWVFKNGSNKKTLKFQYVEISYNRKGGGRSADLKINKSAPLSLNHHTFSNTEPIYTK